jgi:hypothetical protein
MTTRQIVWLLSLVFLSVSPSYAKTYFSCEYSQSNIGTAKVSGFLENRSGMVELSGDAILDNSHSRDSVAFNRQIRVNEETLRYAKYTGSTLFYFYTLSVPKNLHQVTTQNFKAYITAIREGVAGKQDIELKCQKPINIEVMTMFVEEYRNLITYDRLLPEHKEFITPVQSSSDLPENILSALKAMKISIANDWEFENDSAGSGYVINISQNRDENDAMAVTYKGRTIGFIFNITECNSEECYGWDALYLDSNGTVIFKSF